VAGLLRGSTTQMMIDYDDDLAVGCQGCQADIYFYLIDICRLCSSSSSFPAPPSLADSFTLRWWMQNYPKFCFVSSLEPKLKKI
jgi:hypothetical protein